MSLAKYHIDRRALSLLPGTAQRRRIEVISRVLFLLKSIPWTFVHPCLFPRNAEALASTKIYLAITIKSESAGGQFSILFTINNFRKGIAVMPENIHQLTTALDVMVASRVRCPCCQEQHSDTG